MGLSDEEKVRYSRHLNLPQFGIETQLKLKNSSVLVVGTGGLGAPLLQYLTAAGVGKIGVMDFDVVDESNLQRQVLFDSSDIGKSKTTTAIQKLKKQNPNVSFVEFNEALSSFNAKEIIKDFDVVADGTDNFPTRYLVNDACVLLGKANVYASIFQFEGQVSVFNYFDGKEYGPNYRDLFPTPPPPGMVPSCAEGGVIGVLPGIIGSLQASEVIKVLTGIGELLAGRLFLFDALDFSTRVMNVRKDPNNPLNGVNPTLTELIDYEAFCGYDISEEMVSAISVSQLMEWKKSGKNHLLIDVREPYEFETSNIGGLLIPQNEVLQNIDKIPKDIPVVIHCKSGVRSEKAIKRLREEEGYQNLYNLKGGIQAWKNTFDQDMLVV